MPGVHMRDAQCTYTMAPPNFSRLDNPISTKQQGGTDYAQLIITGTPGFSDLPVVIHNSFHMTACQMLAVKKYQL